MNERILRELAPQVLAAVTRRYGRFDLAEDATQEALIAAARQWPAVGVPENPRGWLITVGLPVSDPQAARPSHIMNTPGSSISRIKRPRPAATQIIQSITRRVPTCRLP